MMCPTGRLLPSISFLSPTFLIAGLALMSPELASATVITSQASSFTETALSVTLTIDDSASPGDLVMTLSVDDGFQGDLRGFFAHITDESLLSGLSVSGAAVTDSQFAANAVINLGQGANLEGSGTPCPCDIGVEVGGPGIGQGDDFQTLTFTLSHGTSNLTVALFDGQLFGVRATSVGFDPGDRTGSSKLAGVVPEPSTAILALLGLMGLSAVRPIRAV